MAALYSLGSIAALLVVAGAVFLALDPMKLSPIAGVEDFVPKEVPKPSWELLDKIPRDDLSQLKSSEIKFGGQIFGPESIAFDPQGRGPYSGVADGRVMRWEGEEKGWVEFAVTVPNRTDNCKQPIPLTANLQYEHECGRPLGLRFSKQTGDLYIADAYFGLLKVGPQGGLAELVTDEADGQKFKFCNDLDIDDDGTVYFTDSSAKYPRKKFLLPFLEGEDTGRFLKWDPKTKETSVLLRNLRFPNGVTFSKDHSFLIISESIPGKLLRYWVKGPRAGTMEDFAWLPGYSDNVRTTSEGDFWVAIYSKRTAFEMFMKAHPMLRHAVLKLPISLSTLQSVLTRKPAGVALKYSEDGDVLEVLEDQNGETVKLISEIEEHDGKLYFGSVLVPHVAVYTLGG